MINRISKALLSRGFTITSCDKNMEGLTKLEERVSKLEFVLKDGANDIVRQVQAEILQDLYKIRAALDEDLKDMKTSEKSKENKELLEEIRNLKDENERLKYRILHLKRNLD
ncbi:unnamed protein product [Blepharisma stoltei]|uniref:Uncharacterized protein n=1 Tax=Blepharisma stoltei TaxID=1481888 RepID=A0AAU9JAM0_9CILI|nr:unnamed protein product [Blepharisma stoltei]